MSIQATREQQRERERTQRERQANAAQSQLSALRQQTFEPFPITFNTESFPASEPSEDEQADDETTRNIRNIFGDFTEFSRKIVQSSCPIVNVIHPSTQNHNKKKVEQIFVEMKNKHKAHSTQKSTLPDLDSELNAAAVKCSLKHNGISASNQQPYVQKPSIPHIQPPPLLQPQQQQQSQPQQSQQQSTLSSFYPSSQSSISPHNNVAFGTVQDTLYRSKNNDFSELPSHNSNSNKHTESYLQNGHNVSHNQDLESIKNCVDDMSRSSHILKSIQQHQQLQQKIRNLNSDISLRPANDSAAVTNDNQKNNFKSTLSESSDSDSSSSSEDESGSSDSDSSDGSDSETDKRKKSLPSSASKDLVKKPETAVPSKNNLWDLENFIDCDVGKLKTNSVQSNQSSQNDSNSDQSKLYTNDSSENGTINNKSNNSKNSRQNSKKSTKLQQQQQQLKQKQKAALVNDIEEGEVEESQQPVMVKDETSSFLDNNRGIRKENVQDIKLSSSSNKTIDGKTSSSRNYVQTASAGPNIVDDYKIKEDKTNKSNFKENAEPRNSRNDSTIVSVRKKVDSIISPEMASSQNKAKIISQQRIDGGSSITASTGSSASSTAVPVISNAAVISKHNSSTNSTKDDTRQQQQKKQKRKHSSSDDDSEGVISKRSSKSQRRLQPQPVSPPKNSQKHLKMSDSDNKKDNILNNNINNTNNNNMNDMQDSFVVSIDISKLNRIPNNLKRTIEEEKTKKRQSSPSSKADKSRDKEKSSKNRDDKIKNKSGDVLVQDSSKSSTPLKSSKSSSASSGHSVAVIKKELKDIPLDFGNVRTPPNITSNTNNTSVSSKKVSPLAKGYSAPLVKGQSNTAIQMILRNNIKVFDLFERTLTDSEAMDKARKMKRQADSMADPVKQLSGHLESVMFFITTCLALERKGNEENAARLFEETAKYIEQASNSYRNTKNRYIQTQTIDLIADKKAQIITYRVKGMLNYRVYKYKDKAYPDQREVIAKINSETGLKTFIQKANSPGTGIGIDPSLLLPIKSMLEAYEALINHSGYHIKAHDQWDKADIYIAQNQECREFFDALNSKFGPLSIVMPIEEFVNWTLNALKNLYVTSKTATTTDS